MGVGQTGSRGEVKAMDFLICLWLLALIARFQGADICGHSAHLPRPALRKERIDGSLAAARNRT